MHNSYYFLRQLTKVLEPRLNGSVISQCFSQNKDELVIRFEVGNKSRFLRVNVSPALSCLSFPDKFERARKNSVDLFGEIVGRHVRGVRQFENERSFALLLDEAHTLLFKMHGNRTNVVLFEKSDVRDLFRRNLNSDWDLSLDKIDREIDWTREHFSQNLDRLPSVYFTFGKLVWQYLEQRGFSRLSTEQKWDEIQRVIKQLTTPAYFLTMINNKPALSLLEIGDVRKVVKDPVEAANDFFGFYTHQYSFLEERNKLLGILKARLEAGENYCSKNARRLDEVLADDHYKVWADVLMANLNAIEPGVEKVVLPNFYDNMLPVEIKLRKDASPQKTAEAYYRKAKNQHIEVTRLEQAIQQKKAELDIIRRQIAETESAADLKALKAIAARVKPQEDKKRKQPVPYHEFSFRDFRILVGKNAQANDALMREYSHKDDLWLHAKDGGGSHVLIKHQAGKQFRKDVIEFAASLAAFNSSRKNESLCPVIVTPRKFVRKRKGDPPGTVVVEKEEVIMVEPFKG